MTRKLQDLNALNLQTLEEKELFGLTGGLTYLTASLPPVTVTSGTPPGTSDSGDDKDKDEELEP
jgi:hypothetical protein